MNTMALSSMYPSPTNPRKSFDPKKLEELADSIKSYGVLQPILIRKDAKKPDRFEVVCGERRYRAAKQAGLEEIPVTLRELSDLDVLQIQVIENLQRDDLHPMEEADGYEQLIKKHNVTVVEIAQKVGKSPAYIYQRLKLCSLEPAQRKMFLAGEVSLSIAFLLARVPAKLQAEAVGGIDEWMTPAQIADHIRKTYMLELKKAPFDIKVTDYYAKDQIQPLGGGACGPCPKRTGNQPELFDDVKNGDVCTDPTCFRAKTAAEQQRVIEKAKAEGRKVIVGPEAKKIRPTNWGDLKGGWLNIGADVWVAGKRTTYKKLFAKECPPTTLLQDPHSDDMLELVQVDTVKHLIPNSTAGGHQSLRKKSKKEIDREERAKVKVGRDAELRRQIFAATKGNALGEGDLRCVAQLTYQWMYGEVAKSLVALHGWKDEAGKPISTHDIKKQFSKVDAADLVRSIILVSSDRLSQHLYDVMDDDDAESDDEFPDLLADMAKGLKIDAKAIEDQLLAEARAKREKREANAKAKAAKEKKAVKAKAKKK